MSNQEVVVDALPYIDTGYDEPGVREAAIAMVEEEKKRYRPTKNYLEHLPPLNVTAFETEVMRNEFERLASRVPMDTLSMKRYELPPPPPGKMTDVAAWHECVDNSMAQLEHQSTRLVNLELLSEHGGEAWKSHNELLQQLLSRAQAQLGEYKKSIQEVNWARKSKQSKAGEELRHLESTWVSLVSRNYDIEQACVNLQAQIDIYLSKEPPAPLQIASTTSHVSKEPKLSMLVQLQQHQQHLKQQQEQVEVQSQEQPKADDQKQLKLKPEEDNVGNDDEEKMEQDTINTST